ncbi:MAG: hypothetical protein ACJAXB_001424 [Candidatus Endobugula sp.]|jgi:hypothetical protein
MGLFWVRIKTMLNKITSSLEQRWRLLPLTAQNVIKTLFFGKAFKGIILYIIGSLFAEIGYISLAEQTEEVQSYLIKSIGSMSTAFLWLVLGLWMSGFNLWSIGIKLFLVLFFGVLHFSLHRTTAIVEFNVNWKGWSPNDKWFSRVNSDLKSLDVKTRFNEKLYVNADQVEGKILAQLLYPKQINNKDYSASFKLLKEKLDPWLAEFKTSATESKAYISIADDLKYLGEIPVFLNSCQSFLSKSESSISRKNWEEISQSFENDIFSRYEILSKAHQRMSQIFEDQEFEEERKQSSLRAILFRNLEYGFILMRNHRDKLAHLAANHQFIHGDAGMGKTNLSAHLAELFSAKGNLFLFTQGKRFNDNPENFELNLRIAWGIDGWYTLEEIFTKLNKLGKRRKQRILIIIDGLNETRNNSGFSRIWEKNIEQILHTAKKFQHLFFLFTLRTSYLGRIWTDSSPAKLLKISGFSSNEVTKEAIRKYSDHYSLKVANSDTTNVSFFNNPLMLDLFFKMASKNANRTITLETTTYLKVFDDYINRLMIEVQGDLEKPHLSLVNEALDRSSEAFLHVPQAELPINTFYEAVDNVSRDKIATSTSTADRFLDGQLIFIQDNLQTNNSDIVRHTQQQIGGYLLAKYLVYLYPTGSEISTSSEYSNFLKGSVSDSDTGERSSNTHQLAYDVLTFLVILFAQKGEHFIEFSNDQAVIDLSWQHLRNGDIADSKEAIIRFFESEINSRKVWSKLLDTPIDSLISSSEEFNIDFLHSRLLKLNPFVFDMTWGHFLYNNASYVADILSNGGFSKIKGHESSAQLELFNLLATWSLETTVRTTRDKATLVLLQQGEELIEFIITHLQQFARTKQTYVYERLALIAYGVSLRNQHSEEFVKNKLLKLAAIVFELQFAENPAAPSYNYIVIDSFKHIIDLAIENNVFELPKAQMVRLSNYQFTPPSDWPEVSDEDKDVVDPIVRSWHTDVDPFRGDFVHYTIPRLTKNRSAAAEATVHIHKRLRELGYEKLDFSQPQNQSLKPFFQGESIYGLEGKVDRLGKKYSWMAYFEYAGFLLNIGELDVWDNEEGTQRYNRLSDVGIDPSIPTSGEKSEKIYSFDLFGHRTDSEGWTYKPMYHAAKELIHYLEEGKDYSLLYGMIEKRENNSYDVRSYLLVESFLVRTQDIDGRDDFNSYNSISNVYFGELYWADNTVNFNPYYKDLPSGERRRIERPSSEIPKKLSFLERRHLKKEVDFRLGFNIEAAYSDYNWENQSEVFSELDLTIPSTNIGTHLKLKADSKTLTFLDENKDQATVHFSYEKQESGHTDKQRLSYLRSDLLDRYLKEKGYTLIYQIKQHTYDRNAGNGEGDFRGMQFFNVDALKAY